MNPVLFFDRGDTLPANQKDFRAKAVPVRPTVPLAQDVVLVEVPVEPAVTETVVIEVIEPESVELAPVVSTRRPSGMHPSNLPAKD